MFWWFPFSLSQLSQAPVSFFFPSALCSISSHQDRFMLPTSFGCVFSHWSMADWSGVNVFLEKTEPFSPRIYGLSIAPWQGVEFPTVLPSPWSCLALHRSFAQWVVQRCEFICATVLMYPEDTVSGQPSTASVSYILSSIFYVMIPESLEEQVSIYVLLRAGHLVVSYSLHLDRSPC